MALEGTLRDFSLADIFQLIGLQKKTGVLTLKRDREIVTVSFVDGHVVAAESLHKRIEDRLGNVLVKTGKISRDDLNRALDIQKQTLQRLGYILINEKILSHEDLKSALQVQIQQTVYRLFRWNDGDYHFTQEDAVDYDRENITPMSAESILMDGIRMVDEWPMIERKIKGPHMIFRKTNPNIQVSMRESESSGGFGGDAFGFGFGEAPKKKPKQETPTDPNVVLLGREEMAVYPHINGIFTVGEIIDRSGLTEFDACRALYDLLNRQLVEEVSEKTPEEQQKEIARDRIAEQAYRTALWLLPGLVVLNLIGFRLNPLNLVPAPLYKNDTIAEKMIIESMAREQQIMYGLEGYLLMNGSYPGTLNELMEQGFVDKECLVDPFGNNYSFEPAPGGTGYYLKGHDQDNVEIPELRMGSGR